MGESKTKDKPKGESAATPEPKKKPARVTYIGRHKFREGETIPESLIPKPKK